jgi:hypothetical protein
VRGVVADGDAQAQLAAAAAWWRCRDWSLPETRVAQVVQDLGDAAHAGAADADEVDVLEGVLHARHLRRHSTTRLRSRRPRARGLRPGQRAGLDGHRQQPCRASGPAAGGQRLGVQLGLRQVQAAPCCAIQLRVVALVRWWC